MRTRLALLLVVVLAGTTACGIANRLGGPGQVCTAIGCESQVSVRLAGIGQRGEPGVTKARMCFDDLCDTQRQRLKADGGSFGSEGSKVIVFAEGVDVDVMLLLPPGNYDETTEHRVTVEVSVAGGKPVTLDRMVTLERGQPNGPDCAPVCWQATIEA